MLFFNEGGKTAALTFLHLIHSLKVDLANGGWPKGQRQADKQYDLRGCRALSSNTLKQCFGIRNREMCSGHNKAQAVIASSKDGKTDGVVRLRMSTDFEPTAPPNFHEANRLLRRQR